MDVLRTKLSQHRILLYDVDIRSVKVEYSNYIQTIARKAPWFNTLFLSNWTGGLEVSYCSLLQELTWSDSLYQRLAWNQLLDLQGSSLPFYSMIYNQRPQEIKLERESNIIFLGAKAGRELGFFAWGRHRKDD